MAYGLRAVDVRANLLRVGNVIEGAALDKYSFTRDAYLQKRQADVDDQKPRDGAAPGDGDGQIPMLEEPGESTAEAPARQPAVSTAR
jgi:phospholipid-binding lipoprotein MlaA